MKIRLIGLRNTLGVGVHFSNFADTLKRVNGLASLVEEVNSTSYEELVAASQRSQPDDVNICFTSIDLQPFFKGTNIQWIVFESTRVPEIIMDTMLLADVVWVPSDWGKNTLIANGLDATRCDIVAEGVDTEQYHPYLNNTGNDVIRFLTVGKFEERKSYKEILLAWQSVFAKEHNVELVIKTDHFINVENKQRNLAEFLNLLGVTNVRPIWNSINIQEMSNLYKSADVFLLPSKGEGWGLPIIEAAAQGLPIITTMYSGQVEYLQHIKSSVIPVEFKLDDITCSEFRHFYPTKDNNWGSWAIPRVESIAAALVTAKNNLVQLKQQAVVNSNIIRQRYSWPACVDSALQTLQQRGLIKV
jgi:glycosyltransferase involved in cell wall biosynthesis